MLRFRTQRTQRFRLVMGGLLFAALAGVPLVLGLTRPAASPAAGNAVEQDAPGMVGLYTHGLSSLGVAGLVALPLAMIFAIWLMAGQAREVNRRYLSQSARNRRNLLEAARTLAIIFGSVGLIVGSLAGLYAAMMGARPDLYWELPLPFFTFELAIPCLLIGGAMYAAGRLNR